MAQQITIPISIFEIAIGYARPILNFWLDQATTVQKMFDTFQTWNLNLDDVERITAGKPSEQGVKFKLPFRKISFFFGSTGCKFTKEAATWADAKETLGVLNTALDVRVREGGIQLGKRSTSLALHLQPKSVPFRELLWPFLAPTIAQLENSRPEAMAYVVRWKGRGITLDGSAVLANSVYLLLERDFEPTVSLDEIRTAILNDEATLLKLLGVEEVDS